MAGDRWPDTRLGVNVNFRLACMALPWRAQRLSAKMINVPRMISLL